jgi:hypothetical protein
MLIYLYSYVNSLYSHFQLDITSIREEKEKEKGKEKENEEGEEKENNN